MSWIVPFSWVEVELILTNLCNSLNWKKSFRFEIIEKRTNLIVLFFIFWFEKVFDNLSKKHLSYSNHTSPSCICNKWLCMSILLQKFRKAWFIRNPKDVFKVLSYLLIDFMIVGWVTRVLFSKKVESLIRWESFFKRIFLKQTQSFILQVISNIPDFLSEVKCPSFWVLHKNYKVRKKKQGSSDQFWSERYFSRKSTLLLYKPSMRNTLI